MIFSLLKLKKPGKNFLTFEIEKTWKKLKLKKPGKFETEDY
jgi:hypothetical protein